MITKEQYIASLKKEFNIIRHLAEKIKPEQLSHKPTEKQRTVSELLHYLTYIFIAGATTITTGDADAYKKFVDGPIPTLEDFKDMINTEEEHVMELITPLTEEELAEEITMWGRAQTRAMHLLGLLNIAVAYKMQLFLYLKQSGTPELNTMNLWAGMDQPPKVQ
jgi:hypothetical protein